MAGYGPAKGSHARTDHTVPSVGGPGVAMPDIQAASISVPWQGSGQTRAICQQQTFGQHPAQLSGEYYSERTCWGS